MKLPMWTKVFFSIAVLLIVFCFFLPVSAFDGNDYDGGGGWDGGDWDGDGSYGGGGDWFGVLFGLGVIGAFIAFGFVWIGIGKLKAKIKGVPYVPYSQRTQTGSTRLGTNQGRHIQLPDRTGQIESMIKQHDPNFSASDFISFVKRVYIEIQTAWCMRDISTVRSYLHDNLYHATAKQIQAKIDQGVVYHYECMVVNTVYPTSYAKDAQFEYLTVYLNARMIDWQEDERTGRILRGDKTTRWELRYKMKFMRSMGVRAKTMDSGLTGHNCPNCGAPLKMASSDKCSFCNSDVTTGQYSWVLSDFGTIRNDTVDEGVRA